MTQSSNHEVMDVRKRFLNGPPAFGVGAYVAALLLACGLLYAPALAAGGGALPGFQNIQSAPATITASIPIAQRTAGVMALSDR